MWRVFFRSLRLDYVQQFDAERNPNSYDPRSWVTIFLHSFAFLRSLFSRGTPVNSQLVKRNNSFSGILSLAAVWLASMVVGGCATSKDVDTLREETSGQVSSVRGDVAQTRQSVDAVKADVAQTKQSLDAVKADVAQTKQTLEAVKADVAQVKSLGVMVNSLKSRLDSMQSTVLGLQTETETQRATLIHQLQVEVTLARERVVQMEELIDQLQKEVPPLRGQEGRAIPRN